MLKLPVLWIEDSDIYVDEPIIYDEFGMWEVGKSYGVIPKEYSPKNLKGHWKESLFSVEDLRKMK